MTPSEHTPQTPPRVFKDERDRQIETQARSHALDYMVTAAEILMIACLIKGNPAWKGFLSVTLLGIAGALAHQYKKYESKYFIWVSLFFGLIGGALLLWFCFVD